MGRRGGGGGDAGCGREPASTPLRVGKTPEQQCYLQKKDEGHRRGGKEKGTGENAEIPGIVGLKR